MRDRKRIPLRFLKVAVGAKSGSFSVERMVIGECVRSVCLRYGFF